MTLAHGGQLQSFIWLFIVVLESVCFASDGSNLDVGTVAAASATGSATEGDIGNGEDDEQLQRQLTTLRVCGWLVLLLYVALSLAIVWQTSLHFLYSSASAKKAFHVTLLVSMLLQLSQAIEWIWFPTSHAWKVIYVCRLHSLLLLSFCKSYLAVCWAGVVSAGQQLARRRMTKYVTGMNALLILWGVIVPILLAGYSDNINGQYSFMNSTFRSVLKFSDGFIVLAYGVLLGYQGFCLRRRLQLARGTVPADSVEKSLSQLMLAISIFIVSDLMRILAMVLNESQVAMSILIYLIMYNIIPNIFPTLCMLHLMRRLTRKDGSNVGMSEIKELGAKRTLTKHLTEPDSDGSTGSDGANRENALARTQLEVQTERHESDHNVQSGRESQRSPASCWVRESLELS